MHQLRLVAVINTMLKKEAWVMIGIECMSIVPCPTRNTGSLPRRIAQYVNISQSTISFLHSTSTSFSVRGSEINSSIFYQGREDRYKKSNSSISSAVAGGESTRRSAKATGFSEI
jgi:hypothetical protein